VNHYQHCWVDGSAIKLNHSKAVCVGRNYAQHAKELNNPIPETPLLFLKPSTAFAPMGPQFVIPSDTSCHHELEIAVLIGEILQSATADEIQRAVIGFTVGLDLTLRDRQQQLKEKGHPWELAKAFDGSLPLAPFVPVAQCGDWIQLNCELFVNGQLRQQGIAQDMLTPIVPLIEYISRYFTLLPGDVVMTGTPAGVAALQSSDDVRLTFNGVHTFQTRVV
jgi:2-keto-4-pentenoate hydratase/2-oxohepta-3-ene-1,7-dioic acid hydratase in catechol pathway